MNASSYQKNWFQRHWKWFVPVGIALLSIPIFLSPLGHAAKDFGSLYLNPSLYEDALTQVKLHHEASEFLGKPIETLFLFEGEVQYSEDGQQVKMTIPIKGSKEKARLDIEAAKVNNQWHYKLISLRQKKTKHIIEILNAK